MKRLIDEKQSMDLLGESFLTVRYCYISSCGLETRKSTCRLCNLLDFNTDIAMLTDEWIIRNKYGLLMFEITMLNYYAVF